MSKARLDMRGIRYYLFRSRLIEWGRLHLHSYRPRFRDRRFWVVLGLTILIAAVHDIIEAGEFLHDLGLPYFVPITLFLVPVVYAALNFGFAGALATALWTTVITIPNFIFWHQGWERFGVMFQSLIVLGVAILLGQRVDQEKRARQRTEATRAILRASEIKYRGLFESSPIAILVLDANGTILDANPTAGVLFNRKTEALKSMAVADLVGTSDAQKLLGSSRNNGQPNSIILKRKDGPPLYIEPTLTEAGDGQSNFSIQVLLRDATEERHREAGLRAYAGHMLHIQEEERQRISRELHDDTIQRLLLLYRQLDSLQGTDEPLPTPLIDMLREAKETTGEIVKELRDFTKTLRPPILEDLGLVASVRRLLSDLTQRTALKGQMKTAGKHQRLPADTELGIFRIAQEALWNVERHAKATHVTVTITFTKLQASLDVLDDGIGFIVPPAPGDFTASGQLGLISMQERAKLLNGKLEIQSSPDNGTRVTASIPI